MLRELERALSESADVNRTLRRLHAEGYGLLLFVERRNDEECEDEAPEEGEGPAAQPVPGGREPVFRIHGGDLSFLRSIGIDPTRRIRRRRGGAP